MKSSDPVKPMGFARNAFYIYTKEGSPLGMKFNLYNAYLKDYNIA